MGPIQSAVREDRYLLERVAGIGERDEERRAWTGTTLLVRDRWVVTAVLRSDGDWACGCLEVVRDDDPSRDQPWDIRMDPGHVLRCAAEAIYTDPETLLEALDEALASPDEPPRLDGLSSGDVQVVADEGCEIEESATGLAEGLDLEPGALARRIGGMCLDWKVRAFVLGDVARAYGMEPEHVHDNLGLEWAESPEVQRAWWTACALRDGPDLHDLVERERVANVWYDRAMWCHDPEMVAFWAPPMPHEEHLRVYEAAKELKATCIRELGVTQGDLELSKTPHPIQDLVREEQEAAGTTTLTACVGTVPDAARWEDGATVMVRDDLVLTAFLSSDHSWEVASLQIVDGPVREGMGDQDLYDGRHLEYVSGGSYWGPNNLAQALEEAALEGGMMDLADLCDLGEGDVRAVSSRGYGTCEDAEDFASFFGDRDALLEAITEVSRAWREDQGGVTLELGYDDLARLCRDRGLEPTHWNVAAVKEAVSDYLEEPDVTGSSWGQVLEAIGDASGIFEGQAEGLDWGGPDDTVDSDADGVTDVQELAMGTNPNAQDTDGDGVPDGQELARGSDPLSAPAPGSRDVLDRARLVAGEMAVGAASAVGHAAARHVKREM